MVRVGQIGVGYWGKNLLRNFTELPGCDLTWICDIAEDVRERVAESHPDAHICADSAEVFAAPDVDAVVIARPRSLTRRSRSRRWKPGSTCSSRSPWRSLSPTRRAWLKRRSDPAGF